MKHRHFRAKIHIFQSSTADPSLASILGPFGTPFGSILEAIWASIRVLERLLGPSRGCLVRSLAHFGAVQGHLGGSGGHLGAPRGHLGAPRGPPGHPLALDFQFSAFFRGQNRTHARVLARFHLQNRAHARVLAIFERQKVPKRARECDSAGGIALKRERECDSDP